MRKARVKSKQRAVYHVVNRLHNRAPLLVGVECATLHRYMRQMELFSGAQIITYAFMPNHLHLLVNVPERRQHTEEEVMERLSFLYSKEEVEVIRNRWDEWRETSQSHRIKREMKRYMARMYDISEFMKTIKQRYTQSYNKRYGTSGTCWDDRFRSSIVQSDQEYRERLSETNALHAVAGYIDLNSVRAGILEEPSLFQWSGYGEAMAGNPLAQRNLGLLFSDSELAWPEVRRRYRNLLCGSELSLAVLETPDSGKPEFLDILLQHNPAFEDGRLIGSAEFVAQQIHEHCDKFSRRRRRTP